MPLSLWYRLIIAALTGALLQFISPPVYLHYLHWFCYVPLFMVLDPRHSIRSVKTNFWVGYLCGFVGIFFLFYWLAPTLVLFSNLNFFLSLFVLALFSAYLGLSYGLVFALTTPLQKKFETGWIFLVPAVWVSLEFLTPNIFPYYQGVSQYRVPLTWQVASVFGAYGLTYLIILTNCALADLFLKLKQKRPINFKNLKPLALVFCIMAAVLIYGHWRFDKIDKILSQAPRLRVGLIQFQEKMEERIRYSRREAIDLLKKGSEKIMGIPMDLLVWPENSGLNNPYGEKSRNEFAEFLEPTSLELAALEPSGVSLLAGGDKSGPGGLMWNRSYFINDQGIVMGSYDKMVLIPFGEYLPRPLSFLNRYITGLHTLEAGKNANYFQVGQFRFATPICYEAILEKQVRKMVDGDFLLNITDDGWFGNSAAPYQHAMLASVSAMEFGLPVVREVFNGINRVVEPNGAIVYETKPFEEKEEVVEVKMAKFKTPYKTWGRFFPYFCLLVSVWGVTTGIFFAKS